MAVKRVAAGRWVDGKFYHETWSPTDTLADPNGNPLGGGGATTFLALTDTPGVYGSPGEFVVINGTGNGLVFQAGGGGGSLQAAYDGGAGITLTDDVTPIHLVASGSGPPDQGILLDDSVYAEFGTLSTKRIALYHSGSIFYVVGTDTSPEGSEGIRIKTGSVSNDWFTGSIQLWTGSVLSGGSPGFVHGSGDINLTTGDNQYSLYKSGSIVLRTGNTVTLAEKGIIDVQVSRLELDGHADNVGLKVPTFGATVTDLVNSKPGDIVVRTDNDTLCFRSASSWIALSAGGGGGLWTDAGAYLHPTTYADQVVVGSNAQIATAGYVQVRGPGSTGDGSGVITMDANNDATVYADGSIRYTGSATSPGAFQGMRSGAWVNLDATGGAGLWTDETTYIRNAGPVRIGAAAATTEKLEIEGAVLVGAASGSAGGTIRYTSNKFMGSEAGTFKYFVQTPVSMGGAQSIVHATPLQTDGDMQFKGLQPGSNISIVNNGDYLTINASGALADSDWTDAGTYLVPAGGLSVNVGVGIGSAPTAKLHVAGTTYITGSTGIGTTPGTQDLRVGGQSYFGSNMTFGSASNLQRLNLDGGLLLGYTATTGAGSIRYNSGSFQGHNGSSWLNLASPWTDAGSYLYPAGSEQVHIGGTSAPGYPLRVTGNAYITSQLGIGTAPSTQALRVSGDAYVSDQMGIGTTPSSERLYVNGAIVLSSYTGSTTNGSIRYTGSSSPGAFQGRNGLGAWVDLDQSGGGTSYWDRPGAYLRTATSGDRVHIGGTTDPVSYQLQVTGNTYFTADAYVGQQLGVGTAPTTDALTLNGGIRLGNSTGTTAGTIRWNGSDFQGYDGGWKYLNNVGTSVGLGSNNIYRGIGTSGEIRIASLSVSSGLSITADADLITLTNTNPTPYTPPAPVYGEYYTLPGSGYTLSGSGSWEPIIATNIGIYSNIFDYAPEDGIAFEPGVYDVDLSVSLQNASGVSQDWEMALFVNGVQVTRSTQTTQASAGVYFNISGNCHANLNTVAYAQIRCRRVGGSSGALVLYANLAMHRLGDPQGGQPVP